MWSTQNSTCAEEGNIDTLCLFYSLVARAPYMENLFGTNETVVGSGPGRRYSLVQCSRDLDVRSCPCFGELLNQTRACCIGKRGWRILTPSCYIWYEMYPFYQQTSDSPQSPGSPVEIERAGNGGKSTMKIIIISVSSLAGVFASVLLAGFWYYSSLFRKRKQTDEDHSGEMHHFNLATIQATTNNFSRENKLGEGGLGPVYKIESGSLIHLQCKVLMIGLKDILTN